MLSECVLIPPTRWIFDSDLRPSVCFWPSYPASLRTNSGLFVCLRFPTLLLHIRCLGPSFFLRFQILLGDSSFSCLPGFPLVLWFLPVLGPVSGKREGTFYKLRTRKPILERPGHLSGLSRLGEGWVGGWVTPLRVDKSGFPDPTLPFSVQDPFSQSLFDLSEFPRSGVSGGPEWVPKKSPRPLFHPLSCLYDTWKPFDSRCCGVYRV